MLALVTVFALVSAVVFHVVLAQHQLQLDHLNGADHQGAAHLRAAPAHRVAARRRRSDIIQEAERLGLVVPADPPQYLYVDNAPLPEDDDGSTADTIAELVEDEAEPWPPAAVT